VVACQWLDILFVPLLVLGAEHLDPLPGTKPGAYGGAVIYADYTHSLLGAVVLSALLGALLAIRNGRRAGVVVALVAASHWLLDLPMHRSDMPLLPGNAGDLPRLGFGLWRSPTASALVELGFLLVGTGLYWHAARKAEPSSRANGFGVAALATGLGTLALNFLGM
jgi:hypothetical protein